MFILRVLVGATFVFAGALKIFDPKMFATEIEQYQMVPYAVINLLAVTMPWIEYTCGLLLVLGVWVRASAALIAAMSAVFLVAGAAALARGLKISCGCFGTVGGAFIDWEHIVLDVALVVASVWLVWRDKE